MPKGKTTTKGWRRGRGEGNEKGKKKEQLTLLLLKPCRTWKEQKKQLNQTLSWKGETESKQKRIQLLYVCFCKWFFCKRKKKTILTCFPLYCTAESSRYLMSKSKRLLILLLMLINLLLQYQQTHIWALSARHSTLLVLIWIAIVTISCYLLGGIRSAVEKKDDSQGHTVCYFPDRKETKAYTGFKKSKHSFYKERQMGNSCLGCGGWGFSWEYLDLTVRLLSENSNYRWH